MNKKRALILLFLIIAVGFIVRLPKFLTIIPEAGVFGPKIAWYDETVSIYFSSQNLTRTVALSGLDTTPCLFFVLLHFWLLIVGTGSVALIAILPFIFSLAAIAAIYFLGKEIFDEQVGLFAALLMSLSPLNIQYATEIRAYSVLVLIAIFFILFLLRAIKRGQKSDFIGLAIFTLLLLYTHYSSAALIVPAYILLYYYKKTEIKKIIVCAAAVAVGYIPALMVFERWGDFVGVGSESFYGRFFSHGDIFALFQYLYTIVFGVVGINAVPAMLSIFIIALMIYFWRNYGETKNRILAILVISGWVMLAVLKFIYTERYYIIFTIPMILMFAVVLANLKRKSWLGVVGGAAVIFSLFIIPSYITDNSRMDNSRAFKYFAPSFAQIILNESRPGDIVVADHYSHVLWTQYLKSGPEVKFFFPYKNTLTDDWQIRWRYSDYPIITEKNVILIDSLIEGSGRFWVAGYRGEAVEDPRGNLFKYLDSTYGRLATYYFPQNTDGNVYLAELRLYSSTRNGK
ncbi:MAG: glycosyltransferase family 39 protein [Candidatus Magasanikbacteria bacterium]|nr:glycosyltransferase family 39 protein [Candidatus Magasanikbacteria bacterium]